MQSPEHKCPNLDTKNRYKKIYINLIFIFLERRTPRSDVALFSREDHFCHVFLPTSVNVLFYINLCGLYYLGFS